MNIPIKPPTGPLAPGVTGIEGAREIEATQAPAVEATKSSAQTAATRGSEVQGASERLLARLQAGEVTREQAIDGLVHEALEASGAMRLPAAQRSELEGVLRGVLLDDPTLARLLG